MDENVLSPEQMNSIRVFNYKTITPVVDASMSRANGNLDNALFLFKRQNKVLEQNVSTLQVLLDSLTLKSPEGKPELVEDIFWNHYYYKKYKYQTHIMLVIIAVCIVLNILGSVIDPSIFPAIAGALLSVVFVYIMYTLWDLSMRDDQIFDEYNFGKYSGAHPRNNIYHGVKSTYDTKVDVSNCIVREEKHSYKKL
jgi:hypothetical protein